MIRVIPRPFPPSQRRTAAEHINTSGYMPGMEAVRDVYRFQRGAVEKHQSRVCQTPGIPSAQIQRFQTAAERKHLAHIRYRAGIQFFNPPDFRQILTVEKPLRRRLRFQGSGKRDAPDTGAARIPCGVFSAAHSSRRYRIGFYQFFRRIGRVALLKNHLSIRIEQGVKIVTYEGTHIQKSGA